MKIRTRLSIILIAALVSLVWFSAASLTLISTTRGAIEKSELSRKIIKDAFYLNSLRSEYRRFREERALVQWNSVYSGLLTELDRAENLYVSPAEKNVVKTMRTHAGMIHSLFAQFREARDGTAESILAGRLAEKSQQFVLSASKLADLSNEQKISSIKKLIVCILFFLVNALFLLLWARRTVIRNVIRPIEKLQQGVKIASAGNLSHQITMPAVDELGYLADEFNRMTANLSRSYGLLEHQLEIQTAAEKQIRELNEDLEKRVEERTRELSEINVVLEKEIERRARIEAERESFFKLSIDLCCISGTDGYYKEVNEAFTRTLGYTKEELLDRPFLEKVHPEDQPASFDLVERLKSGEPSLYFENRIAAKNGLYRWIAWSSVPSDDRTLIYSVGRDVTLLKRDAEKIKEQAELINLTHDAIILRGLDNRVTFWNKGAEELYGWTFDDAVGRETHELYAARSSDVNEIIETKLRETERWTGELAHSKRDGTVIYVESRWAVLKNSEGKPAGVMEINRDITQKVEVERALASYTERLRRSNEEMAASNRNLEQFAYAASHDLKEPLRAISVYLELLKEEYSASLEADANMYVDIALKGALRAQDMIDAMLEYSRIGTKAKAVARTSMESVFEEMCANLRMAIKDNQAEITRDPLPDVMADPFQMLQLVQNLAANGMKFRKKGEPPRIHVSAKRENGFFVFSVRDNGIGIAQKHHEKIFSLFERLHSESEYPGTGIGLSLCKKIVEKHGGSIWLESEEGKGCCFYFSIPVLEDIPAPDAPKAKDLGIR